MEAGAVGAAEWRAWLGKGGLAPSRNELAGQRRVRLSTSLLLYCAPSCNCLLIGTALPLLPLVLGEGQDGAHGRQHA